jgi:hypothetical protein
LQILGTIDTDLSKLTANELMLWGLANLWTECKEGGYAVKHGRRPVSDFGVPRQDCEGNAHGKNYFEKAFPCLFPYGCGGIKAARVVSVSFREHVKWALQYHDHQFRRDETFPFLAFGIEQRREALGSARMQMNGKNFERDARILASITSDQLAAATALEERGGQINNPAIRLLQRHVHATAGRVMGSNQSRYREESNVVNHRTLGPAIALDHN